MSILKSKHSGWTHEGTRTPYMGGGGGGQAPPTTTYSQTSNIPDYAKPYVETMLGATQKQLFKMDDSGITGFEPYKAYSKDPNDYVAGFSPLQQQAQSGAANLQVPGQYGQASRMTGQAGMGSLGLAGQMAGTGQQYAMGATDPRTTQAYMSPYMQNVVDYQKSQALRDYQMSQPMMQARAVGQGAFGGNRLALQQSEAQRGLMSQLQGIEATGAQSAFQNAQQAQQFGANLGLQGQQAALGGLGQYGQMAGQLGQLGTAQLGAQQGIIGTQAAQGAAQQAQEQSKINQAIQDYAIQQQYPLMQLGFMSNMLRGLPMQAQTTQLYQAQPSTMQQGIGLLGAGASLMGAQGRAGGGEIKEMAEGGITSIPGYKYGKLISEPKLESMADKLDIGQLQKRLQDPQLDRGEREVFAAALEEKSKDKARYAGIGAAGGGLFDTMGYAGGGILAFAGEDESLVQDPQFGGGQNLDADQARLDQMKLQKDREQYEFLKTASPVAAERLLANNPMLRDAVAPPAPAPAPKPEVKPEVKAAPAGPSAGSTGSKASSGVKSEDSSISGILAGLKKEGPKGELGADALQTIEENLSGAGKRMSRAEKIAMAQGFLEFGGTAAPGGMGQAGIAGLKKYTEGYGKAIESDEKYKAELAKQKSDILNLRRAEERGDVKLASEIREKIEDRANRLQTTQISAAATGRAGDREDKAIQQIMKEKGIGYTEALQTYKRAGLNVESTDVNALTKAISGLQNDLLTGRLSKEEQAATKQKIAQLNQRLIAIGMNTAGGAQTSAVGNGNLVQNKDGSFNYVPK